MIILYIFKRILKHYGSRLFKILNIYVIYVCVILLDTADRVICKNYIV